MIYPTGDLAQPDTVTLTLTVPVLKDNTANDYILSAITGQLLYLTNPYAWRDTDYTITAEQAAAMALSVFNSMTIT